MNRKDIERRIAYLVERLLCESDMSGFEVDSIMRALEDNRAKLFAIETEREYKTDSRRYDLD